MPGPERLLLPTKELSCHHSAAARVRAPWTASPRRQLTAAASPLPASCPDRSQSCACQSLAVAGGRTGRARCPKVLTRRRAQRGTLSEVLKTTCPAQRASGCSDKGPSHWASLEQTLTYGSACVSLGT